MWVVNSINASSLSMLCDLIRMFADSVQNNIFKLTGGTSLNVLGILALGKDRKLSHLTLAT